MVQTAVTQVVKTLNDVHQRFGLRRSPDEQFFTEWHTNLPSLDASEQATLDQIRQRFRYHREEGWFSIKLFRGRALALSILQSERFAG